MNVFTSDSIIHYVLTGILITTLNTAQLDAIIIELAATLREIIINAI